MTIPCHANDLMTVGSDAGIVALERHLKKCSKRDESSGDLYNAAGILLYETEWRRL